MKEDIRDLKGAVDRIWYGILGVWGTLILSILSIVGYFLRSWWQNRGKADNVDAVDRLAEQITNLTLAQAENSNQIAKLTSSQTEILERISAQAETSETGNFPGDPKVPSMEGVDELTGDIRSQQRDAGETV